MNNKIGRRSLLLGLAGLAGTGTVVKAEAKPLTTAGVAKSLLTLAEKAQREAQADVGNASKWTEVGLIITAAAQKVMGVKVTGRGVRRDGEKGGEGDGTRM